MPCAYYANGTCPRLVEHCRYAHGEADLRARQPGMGRGRGNPRYHPYHHAQPRHGPPPQQLQHQQRQQPPQAQWQQQQQQRQQQQQQQQYQKYQKYLLLFSLQDAEQHRMRFSGKASSNKAWGWHK